MRARGTAVRAVWAVPWNCLRLEADEQRTVTDWERGLASLGSWSPVMFRAATMASCTDG